MSFFNELKRRNVLRVGAAYVVGAWLLIQVVETIFPLFGFDEAPARIVVIVLAIAFVPVLILAWAFELTPEGLKKESEVDRTQSVAPNTGKKLDRVIMVVMALSLGYFAFDKFVLTPQRDAEQLAVLEEQKTTEVEHARQAGRTEAMVESYGEKSIAVLAFQDMSQDKDQEYLSDGIAEELLNLLAKIPELRVISRSSAFSYKGENIKLAQVAEELNVAHILEGSVRKAGNRVRITAQLIEARSDTHLWSETYDRTLDDIFAIQDEIAAAVVGELKVRLLGDETEKHHPDPEVYALFLQGRYLINQGSLEGIQNGIEILTEVLEKDMFYAPAWSELQRAYGHQISTRQITREEGLPIEFEAINKAIDLDPDDAISLSRLGWMKMKYEGDLVAAAKLFERALALEPGNAIVLGNAAILLKKLGRNQQSIILEEWAVQRDPLNPTSTFNLSWTYFVSGRLNDAEAMLRKTLLLSPGYAGAPNLLARVLYNKGDLDAARQLVETMPTSIIQILAQTVVHHAEGDDEQFDASLRTLIEEHMPMSTGAVAFLYAFRGDSDAALNWLQKAVDLRGSNVLINFRGAPELRAFRQDPRFEEMLERYGLTDRQLAIKSIIINQL